ncbi:urokinase plasminogen activator surface receptor-like isoform X2 [Mugil cephalus]|uniref:urokinase plasminogen activator surface receptor-like isoform X2 n=1 Tax=Mugil cephalus TaxID=48193 RepID=UPI001FB5A948|nr:urokinase plasminogen activator surface receptor-like isoform X2 [Mugil cephalus]
MYLLILVLGIVLLPEASTLRCYQCTPGPDGNCTYTAQCPSEKYLCAVQRYVFYINGSVWNSTRRSCVLPEECGELSLNYGFYRDVIASKCCNTDLCNTQPPPEITPPVPSGIKCTTCDEQGCNAALNCLGNEDRCISATDYMPGQMVTLKACASEAACHYMQTALMTETTAAEVNCCQSDYCNSGSSTSTPTTSTTTITTTTPTTTTTTTPTTTPTTSTTTTTPATSTTASTSAGLLLLVAPLISLVLS